MALPGSATRMLASLGRMTDRQQQRDREIVTVADPDRLLHLRFIPAVHRCGGQPITALRLWTETHINEIERARAASS